MISFKLDKCNICSNNLYFRATFDTAKFATDAYIKEVSAIVEERLSTTMELTEENIKVYQLNKLFSTLVKLSILFTTNSKKLDHCREMRVVS